MLWGADKEVQVVGNPQSDKIAEQVGSFLQSDAWRVVKYRLLTEFIDKLQTNVNIDVKQGKMNSATLEFGKMEGVKLAVDITERIPSEINKGQLVVDVALRVIENKQRREMS